MSIGTSMTFFLSFQGFECLLSKFFIPDKKWMGSLWCHLFLNFAPTGVAVLFSSLYTWIFFACNKNTSSNKRKSLEIENENSKWHIFLLIRIPILLTSCCRVNKKVRHTRCSIIWTLTFSNPQTPNRDWELI